MQGADRSMEHPLRYQLLPNAPADQADVLVLPVAHAGEVCGASGTRAAPAAILEASGELEYFEEDQAWSPMRHMKVAVLPELHASELEREEAFHGRIATTAAALPRARDDRLLVALGGDHSITPSLTAGCLGEPATILFLDAHADLRPQYRGSEYSHACPAHQLREQGHRIVMVGVRSMFEREAERIESDDCIELYGDRALREASTRQRLVARVESLTGPVWLSTDMDVFDPALVPGVGTPQPGGLDWHFAIDLLEALLLRSKGRLCGMDIVELVPEPSRVSQLVAAKWMQKAISFWGKARGYDRAPEEGSQAGLEYE